MKVRACRARAYYALVRARARACCASGGPGGLEGGPGVKAVPSEEGGVACVCARWAHARGLRECTPRYIYHIFIMIKILLYI